LSSPEPGAGGEAGTDWTSRKRGKFKFDLIQVKSRLVFDDPRPEAGRTGFRCQPVGASLGALWRRKVVFEEEQPKKKVVHTIGEDLATLSIDELVERIDILRAEISRLEEAIAAKRASADVAASFFKR
jgi:uncharacterized small protein (DUF1192 family)